MQFHGDLDLGRKLFVLFLLPITTGKVLQYMADTLLAWNGKKKESTETTKHKGDSWGATCFLTALCSRQAGPGCSLAYCSLAWVNKEKTGAIRQTRQAWNSLLVFTPFTLGLSQALLHLSWFFDTAQPRLVFQFKSKQTIPTSLSPLGWQRKICPRTSALKKKHRLLRCCRVPQQTTCRIKAKGWCFCDHTRSRHHPRTVLTPHEMAVYHTVSLCLVSVKWRWHSLNS